MINFKKYNTRLARFVVFLTMLLQLAACATTGLQNTKIEAKKTPVSATLQDDPKIEAYIAPYRSALNQQMDIVLAYAPETFDKSKGKWNTNIGILLANATLLKTDKRLFMREKQHVDGVMLNNGGIRAIIPKGNVTMRTAFEIMPFENSLKVVKLKGTQIREMAAYIARERKPHPLAGITITLTADNQVKSITVQGQPLDDTRIYNIATIDYLIGGGDNMVFWSENEGIYDLEYKLRDLYIDYFKETDTLPVSQIQHIITE